MKARLSLLPIIISLAACSGGGGGGGGGPSPQPSRTAVSNSGDGQSGPVGAPLTAPFVVRVFGSDSGPEPGVAVSFAITRGGGSLSAVSATTDGNGLAQTSLTLGPNPGTNSVEATVPGVAGALTFTADGQAPPPPTRTATVESGDDQTGVAGSPLAMPLVVRVVDGNGQAEAGIALSFQVTGGGGSLSAMSATTDGNGLAQTSLTLGPNPGANRVEATVPGASGPLTFNAQGTAALVLLNQAPLPTSAVASGVVVADLDGDGRLDIASSDRDTNALTIYLQRSPGQLALSPQSPLPVGTEPLSLAAGDLNNDGLADLVCGNRTSRDLSLYLQQGGSLRAAPSLPLLPNNDRIDVIDLAVADINNDGRADVLARREPERGDQQGLNVLLQNGGGTLGPAPFSPLDTRVPRLAAAIAVGDLSGDGLPDVVINGDGSELQIFIQSAGGLSPGAILTADEVPRSVAVADINNDGLADILSVGAFTAGKLTVYYQTSPGFVAPAPFSPLAVGNFPTHVCAGDLNSDGRADLVVVNSQDETALVLLQSPSGSLAPALGSPFPIAPDSTRAAIGDVNSDGKNDLIIAGQGLTIYVQP